MFKIGNIEIKNQVVMAPMAGITNMAFRKIIKDFGAGLVYKINSILNLFYNCF